MSTNYPHGVNNLRQQHILGALGVPSPISPATFFDDFNNYTGDAWNLTIDTGSIQHDAISAGGVIVLATGAADDDLTRIATKAPGFTVITQDLHDAWFAGRWFLEQSNTLTTVGVGLGDTGLVPANGIFFSVDEGSREVHFRINTTSNNNIDIFTGFTLDDGGASGFYTTAWHFDARTSQCTWEISIPSTQSLPAEVVRGVVNVDSGAGGNLPAANMAPFAAVQTEELVVKQVNVDYLFAASDRRSQTGF